jgi:hypothetical protein
MSEEWNAPAMRKPLEMVHLKPIDYVGAEHMEKLREQWKKTIHDSGLVPTIATAEVDVDPEKFFVDADERRVIDAMGGNVGMRVSATKKGSIAVAISTNYRGERGNVVHETKKKIRLFRDLDGFDTIPITFRDVVDPGRYYKQERLSTVGSVISGYRAAMAGNGTTAFDPEVMAGLGHAIGRGEQLAQLYYNAAIGLEKVRMAETVKQATLYVKERNFRVQRKRGADFRRLMRCGIVDVDQLSQDAQTVLWLGLCGGTGVMVELNGMMPAMELLRPSGIHTTLVSDAGGTIRRPTKEELSSERILLGLYQWAALTGTSNQLAVCSRARLLCYMMEQFCAADCAEIGPVELVFPKFSSQMTLTGLSLDKPKPRCRLNNLLQSGMLVVSGSLRAQMELIDAIEVYEQRGMYSYDFGRVGPTPDEMLGLITDMGMLSLPGEPVTLKRQNVTLGVRSNTLVMMDMVVESIERAFAWREHFAIAQLMRLGRSEVSKVLTETVRVESFTATRRRRSESIKQAWVYGTMTDSLTGSFSRGVNIETKRWPIRPDVVPPFDGKFDTPTMAVASKVDYTPSPETYLLPSTAYASVEYDGRLEPQFLAIVDAPKRVKKKMVLLEEDEEEEEDEDESDLESTDSDLEQAPEEITAPTRFRQIGHTEPEQTIQIEAGDGGSIVGSEDPPVGVRAVADRLAERGQGVVLVDDGKITEITKPAEGGATYLIDTAAGAASIFMMDEDGDKGLVLPEENAKYQKMRITLAHPPRAPYQDEF